jgi:outer membrane protein
MHNKLSMSARSPAGSRHALGAQVVIASLALLAVAGQAAAQSVPATSTPASAAEPSSTQWGLGLAVNVRQQPYLGADSKTRALPVLYIENAWLRVAGTTADAKLGTWNLGPSHSLSFTGRVRYAGEGYEADDAFVLRGMAERKSGLWGGAAVAWNTPFARLSADWTADLSGHSKGQMLQLQLDRRFGFGQLSLTPRVQAQWLDKKYVDYYYGVRAGEVLPGRPLYTGESATTLQVGMRLDYAIQPRHSVFLDVSATRLPDEIKNSPLVDRSTLSSATVGYLYRF